MQYDNIPGVHWRINESWSTIILQKGTDVLVNPRVGPHPKRHGFFFTLHSIIKKQLSSPGNYKLVSETDCRTFWTSDGQVHHPDEPAWWFKHYINSKYIYTECGHERSTRIQHRVHGRLEQGTFLPHRFFLFALLWANQKHSTSCGNLHNFYYFHSGSLHSFQYYHVLIFFS